MQTIRVLVADDQDVVRFGVRAMLGAGEDVEIVGEADNGARAVSQVRELSPDVVLMDISMPDVDGITALRKLMGEVSPPRVLMLTTFDVEDQVLTALDAGADGYLVKGCTAEELLSAVRAVHSGSVPLSPSVMRTLVAKSTNASTQRAEERAQRAAARLAELSDRERELIALIAQGASNQEIARRMHFTLSTVKSYVSRLLTQLGLNNRTQAAIMAYEANLRGDDDSEGSVDS